MAVSGDLGRYRPISTIGVGGMATVQLAQDTILGREVALKRVSGEADVPGLTRLRREALVGASFSHVNLVSVYDVVTTEDGHLVIVMEYVQGETLRHVLTSQGRLAAAEALPILAGVAAGLDAINERGIVHRDVKPSNVLLGADGAVKLADLGIASAPDRTRITTSGSVLGSLSYMAPEQLSDAPATPAIDVYALAAVAFEVLSGVKARREPHAVALAHAISTQGPPSLRDAWPQAPPGVDELLRRGMARDPRERPRSAGELVARLRSALEPQDTAQLPTQPVRSAPVAPRAVRPAPPPRRPPAVGARTPAAVSASPRRAPDDAEEHRQRRQPRTGLLIAALLALLAGAVALVVVLTSGGSPHSPAKQASHTRPHPARTRPPTSSSTRATTATAPSTTTRTGRSATQTTTTAAASSSTPSSTTRGAVTAAGAGSPVAAVKSFYGLGAAHSYPQAWALADSAMQAQLGGYGAFQSGFAADRSITFTSARTLSQSASSARVAVTTTSVRTDGTKSCTGTIDLVPSTHAAQWQLHQIQISCS